MNKETVLRGRVLRVSGLHYLVEVDGAIWQCRLRGRLKEGARQTTSPVIAGDWVDVGPTGPQAGVIDAVLPRTTRFSRGPSRGRPYAHLVAANLDQLVVVEAVHEPEARPGFIDRAIIMALKGGMTPVVCINKIDLVRENESGVLASTYVSLGYGVHRTSALTGEGIAELRVALQGRTSALVGQSGVGKSSLINCIDPQLELRTERLMRQHDRGRHTTAAAELHQIGSGGYLLDTPGIKQLQLHGIERSALAQYFVEMEPLLGSCRFRDCLHLHEPGCAVRAAVTAGDITDLRYAGYVRIMQNL